MDLTYVSQLEAELNRAAPQHFRLIWLVGSSPPQRTALLRALCVAGDRSYIELGKVLSTALLEVPVSLRTASVDECFSISLAVSSTPVICLDRIEILFEPSLRINPVSLIKSKSRHSLLVASWPGSAEGDCLVFGPPRHPSHIRIRESDLESIVHHL